MARPFLFGHYQNKAVYRNVTRIVVLMCVLAFVRLCSFLKMTATGEACFGCHINVIHQILQSHISDGASRLADLD